VVEQPLPGHVPARALDLLPHRAQGHSPQARSALIIRRRRKLKRKEGVSSRTGQEHRSTDELAALQRAQA
jgi:hypothetical protein